MIFAGPGSSSRRAKRCMSAMITELSCEHMEITVEPHRSRIIASTLEFLQVHLALREVE